MTDETRARFLAAIAREIAAERVIEVHLFPAINQGGMESGVAVIAVAIASATPDPDAKSDLESTMEESPYLPTAQQPSRYTVYSARYRHTLKGIDRGKWEVSVTDEAVAPLLTVDAVVRGVQRRSGDAEETIRLSGDDFRALLPVGPIAA